ncbi:hypothetical protein BDR04DRAFT_1156711 [Suillus decipiens]|nr:hypothetical protein BDR04DRAFT_1156711 [Suillus decipiens]
MALIAPELIVTWAMRQWLSARRVTKQFKESGYPNVGLQVEEVPIEAPEDRFHCHTPFIQVLLLLAKGVFFVLVSVWHFPCTLVNWIKTEQPEQDYTWSRTHSFFVLMGGFMLYVDGKPYHTLQPDEVLELIRKGCIDAPALTEKQIDDKSKGNAVSKGLVMLQVAWFVMQLIARVIYHLEITQLEVGTLTFAVLNFLTYALWWNKPLDVQCPHPVHLKKAQSELDKHLVFTPRAKRTVVHPLLELIGMADIPTYKKLRVPTFDGNIDLERSDRTVLQVSGLLMATIFGGIHCMAWLFAFPTYQEQMLWRISAVITTCTPWFCVNAYLQRKRNIARLPVVMRVFFDTIFWTYVGLYISTRAVLLVLMFTTLRNLPTDAYKAVLWSSLVPHL